METISNEPSGSQAPPPFTEIAADFQETIAADVNAEQPAKVKRKPSARVLVMGAIRTLKNDKGSSFGDIKKYVTEKFGSNEIRDMADLKEFAETAVQKGILEKNSSRYKIKEAATRSKDVVAENPSESKLAGGSKKEAKSGSKKEDESGSKTKESSTRKEPAKRKDESDEKVKPEAKKRMKKTEVEG